MSTNLKKKIKKKISKGNQTKYKYWIIIPESQLLFPVLQLQNNLFEFIARSPIEGLFCSHSTNDLPYLNKY